MNDEWLHRNLCCAALLVLLHNSGKKIKIKNKKGNYSLPLPGSPTAAKTAGLLAGGRRNVSSEHGSDRGRRQCVSGCSQCHSDLRQGTSRPFSAAHETSSLLPGLCGAEAEQ